MREPTDIPVEVEGDERLLRELFPLDDGAGPAPRRSAAQLDQLFDAAFDAFQGPAPQPDPAPACPADLNNDGSLDFFDVQMYLNLYSAGCP